MTNPSHNGAARSDLMFVVATALLLIGLVAVATSLASLDRALFGSNFWQSALGRQAVFVVAGIVVIVFTRRVGGCCLRSERIRRWGPRLLYAMTMACLMAVLVPGLVSARGGSHRWLRFAIGGYEVGLQPSELAKVSLVLLLASLLSERGVDVRSFRRGFLPASVVVGFTVLLVGMEDFGTAVLLAGVGTALLAVAGCRLRYLVPLAVIGVGGLAGLLFAAPYRLQRIKGFFDFWSDPQGAGYQPLQSLATIASGGWSGTGLGLGVQKYGYLPASHTDFVFAVICEEMGILGGVLVIALFGLLVWLALRTMLGARSTFERLLTFGLAATLGLQVVMNIAVVTVMTPTTGISLPLISAGGSGILVFSFAIGLMAAVARNSEQQTAHEPAFVLGPPLVESME